MLQKYKTGGIRFRYMDTTEVEKSKVLELTELTGYVSGSTVTRMLVRKNTGIIRMDAVDADQVVQELTTPFDTFVYVIDGEAEITVDDKLVTLVAGQCILIPPHSRNTIRAKSRFKMISIVIKSGYEDL